MEFVILIVLIVCVVAYLISSPSHEPAVSRYTNSVETVVMKNGDIIDLVDLRDIADLDEVDMIETSDLHLMYADEYPPFNELIYERDCNVWGLISC